jgi:hypothetical protein
LRHQGSIGLGSVFSASLRDAAKNPAYKAVFTREALLCLGFISNLPGLEGQFFAA